MAACPQGADEREGHWHPLTWSVFLRPRTHSGGSHDVRGAVDAPVASRENKKGPKKTKATELRPTANVVAMTSKRSGSGTGGVKGGKRKKRLAVSGLG